MHVGQRLQRRVRQKGLALRQVYPLVRKRDLFRIIVPLWVARVFAPQPRHRSKPQPLSAQIDKPAALGHGAHMTMIASLAVLARTYALRTLLLALLLDLSRP